MKKKKKLHVEKKPNEVESKNENEVIKEIIDAWFFSHQLDWCL